MYQINHSCILETNGYTFYKYQFDAVIKAKVCKLNDLLLRKQIEEVNVIVHIGK